METVDDETSAAAIGFMERGHAEAGTPWFMWWNGTRMHFRTHVKEELRGISGQDEYADGMVEHDMHVGKLLDKLDELGIADNTIVFYSTDNGPHYNTWPDAAATPFRGEKNTNWEGGWRVPAMVRWPGKIEPGSVSNEIMHHMDWLPTFVAAAGKPTGSRRSCSTGRCRGDRTRVQRPSRRLQLPAAPDGRETDETPRRGDLLLLGRRRPHRAALRRLEADLHGAARGRHVRAVAVSVRAAAGPAISTTCGATPTSGRRSRPTPTTTG